MPWRIEEVDGMFCLAKEDTGERVPGSCHADRKETEDMMAAMYASEGKPMDKTRKKSAFVIDRAAPGVAKNALKSISIDGDELRVANHIILFGDKDHRDLDNEFFTRNTDLESHYTRNNLVIEDFEHGYTDDGVGPSQDDIFGRVDWKTATIDEYGVWVERVLDRRNKYVEYIQPLLEAGMLGTSSESISKDVTIEKTGEIKKWPLKRDTLTVMPAEPRMMTDNVMRAIKSLAIALPVQEAKPEAATNAAVVTKPQEKAVQLKAGVKPKGKTMYTKEQIKALKAYAELNSVESWEDLSEAQQKFALEASEKPEPVDVAEIAKTAAAEAVKAYAESQPAINENEAGTVVVTHDEADTPFKSLAANCLAVKEYEVSKGQKVAPRLKFLKAALGGSEGVPSDGGLLLDPTLTNEIIKPMHEVGPFSNLARKLPVSSNSNYGWINGIAETSRETGSRWGGIRGYRLAEAASKTSSKPTFRRINWELKKYAVLVYGTDELLADVAMFSEIVKQGSQEELAFMLNDDIMNGLGTAGPQGFMQSGSLITVTRTDANDILGADISSMYNRMDIRGRKSAVWFIGNDSQPKLDKLFAVGSTAVTFPYASMGMDGVQRLYNRPVVVTEFNQTIGTAGDIVFADMSQYLLWEKGGVEAAVSIHVQFLTDESVFRFVYRADGKSSVDSALTPYKGSTTTSPFVNLLATS